MQEPFRIKVVEPPRRVTREERELRLAERGLNVFAVPAESVPVDLLADSDTPATSDRQWAAACSRNCHHFRDTVRDIFGYPIAIPRRVCTSGHLRYVAEPVIALHRERARFRDLSISWEAPALRRFTARLEELARP
jgi:tryptophanase